MERVGKDWDMSENCRKITGVRKYGKGWQILDKMLENCRKITGVRKYGKGRKR